MTTVASVLSTTGTTATVEKKDNLGRDDFLKMFLAQLNHQDPLNPMDDKDMSAQLAQFSSLEQLFNVNENLETLQSVQEANNQLSVLECIGKEAVASGNQLLLEEGKTAKATFVLAGDAYCTITIKDAEGQTVRQEALKTLGAGEQTYVWNGHDQKNNIVPAGVYTYTIDAVGGQDEPVAVGTTVRGLVTKVQYLDGQPVLYIGAIPISLSQLISIQTASE